MTRLAAAVATLGLRAAASLLDAVADRLSEIVRGRHA